MSVADVQDAMRASIRRRDDDPTPSVWTKPAEAILANSGDCLIRLIRCASGCMRYDCIISDGRLAATPGDGR